MEGDRSYLGEMYITNLFAPDAVFRPGESIHHIALDKGKARRKKEDEVPVTVLKIPSLGPDLRGKEKDALEWLKKDLADGRRVIIAMCQTASRDIQDRWQQIIVENVPEAKAFILRASVKAVTRSRSMSSVNRRRASTVPIRSAVVSVIVISTTESRNTRRRLSRTSLTRSKRRQSSWELKAAIWHP
jgi:hypothetical protein